MHKSDQKSSKKNTCTQKEGKMEQEKTCVFFLKKEKEKENELENAMEKKGKET